jgi:hypothetical protein
MLDNHNDYDFQSEWHSANFVAEYVVNKRCVPARILCVDMLNEDSRYPVIALIREDNTEWLYYFTSTGRSSTGHLRLRKAPMRVSRWVNVSEDMVIDASFSSREEADENAKTDRTSVVEFVFEDGRLVEIIKTEVEQ